MGEGWEGGQSTLIPANQQDDKESEG